MNHTGSSSPALQIKSLDGTYLSRNFATLGPFTWQPPCASGWWTVCHSLSSSFPLVWEWTVNDYDAAGISEFGEDSCIRIIMYESPWEKEQDFRRLIHFSSPKEWSHGRPFQRRKEEKKILLHRQSGEVIDGLSIPYRWEWTGSRLIWSSFLFFFFYGLDSRQLTFHLLSNLMDSQVYGLNRKLVEGIHNMWESQEGSLIPSVWNHKTLPQCISKENLLPSCTLFSFLWMIGPWVQSFQSKEMWWASHNLSLFYCWGSP